MKQAAGDRRHGRTDRQGLRRPHRYRAGSGSPDLQSHAGMCQTGPDEKGSKGKTMRKTLLPLVTLSALALPAAALAQAACPADPPPPDPCLVGKLGRREIRPCRPSRLAMPAMAAAGVSVETIPGPPPVLGMTIYEDGFYETLPIHAECG